MRSDTLAAAQSPYAARTPASTNTGIEAVLSLCPTRNAPPITRESARQGQESRSPSLALAPAAAFPQPLLNGIAAEGLPADPRQALEPVYAGDLIGSWVISLVPDSNPDSPQPDHYADPRGLTVRSLCA